MVLLAILIWVALLACAEESPRSFLESSPWAVQHFAHRIIDFPVGEHLVYEAVNYRNYEAEEVRWGDPVGGFYEYHYFFDDSRLVRTELILSIPEDDVRRVVGQGTVRYTDTGFVTDGVTSTPGGTYEVVVESDTIRYIPVGSPNSWYVEANEDLITVFAQYSDVDSGPGPQLRIDLESEEIVLSEYATAGRFAGELRRRSVYREGILVERQDFRLEQREIFSVLEGTGTLQVFDLDGNLTQEAALLRERDEYGLLTYERVLYPSGAAVVSTWRMEY